MRKTENLGWLEGVYLATKETKLLMDPTTSRIDEDAYVLISHAHADHTTGFTSRSDKYSTIETKRMFEELRGIRVKGFHPIRIGETVQIGELKVKALNSGHMLGSAQFLIETPEKTILYTGDINYVDTLTTEAADTVKCDTLIIEGTYGDPAYRFPPRETVYSKIVKWAVKAVKKNRTPILHVYAAGKAQEAVRLFNEYTILPVAVDDRVDLVNKVFNEHKNGESRLRYLKLKDGGETGVHVEVTSKPYGSVSRPDAALGRATGWALTDRLSDGCFPLSSHADFYQLLEFIEACSAKEVYVFTGFTESFANYIKRKVKVKAKPLPFVAQRRLLDFK